MVVRIRRAADPDLIIRLADGTHAAIAMSWTDYAGSAAAAEPPLAPCLLDLAGLRQAAALVARLRQEGTQPSAAGA
jgi:hypothetical protein